MNTYVSNIFLLFCSEWTKWRLNNFFDAFVFKYMNYTNTSEKSQKNLILWQDIFLAGICYEIEKVNTQLVVRKFFNKNPVVINLYQ